VRGRTDGRVGLARLAKKLCTRRNGIGFMHVKFSVHELLVESPSLDDGVLSRAHVFAPCCRHFTDVGRAEPTVFDSSRTLLGWTFRRPVVVWSKQEEIWDKSAGADPQGERKGEDVGR
jgi:hypothetical protein